MLVAWDNLDTIIVIVVLMLIVLGNHQENDLMRALISLALNEYVSFHHISNIYSEDLSNRSTAVFKYLYYFCISFIFSSLVFLISILGLVIIPLSSASTFFPVILSNSMNCLCILLSSSSFSNRLNPQCGLVFTFSSNRFLLFFELSVPFVFQIFFFFVSYFL